MQLPVFTSEKTSGQVSAAFSPALAGGGGGGGFLPPPSEIFAITPTFLELATRNLAYLILHHFDIDGANFVKIGVNFLEKMAFL